MDGGWTCDCGMWAAAIPAISPCCGGGDDGCIKVDGAVDAGMYPECCGSDQGEPMGEVGRRCEAGVWVGAINVGKMGAYRREARVKLKDDADDWHW